MNVYRVWVVQDEAPVQIQAERVAMEHGTLVFYGEQERDLSAPVIAAFNAFASFRLIETDAQVWSYQEGE
jgi:hypothetical protein